MISNDGERSKKDRGDEKEREREKEKVEIERRKRERERVYVSFPFNTWSRPVFAFVHSWDCLFLT